MSDLPIVILQGPSHDLSLTALASWLGIDVKDVRQLIKDGWLPNGRKRRGQQRLTWSPTDAAICRWLLENSDRFEGTDLPPEE